MWTQSSQTIFPSQPGSNETCSELKGFRVLKDGVWSWSLLSQLQLTLLPADQGTRILKQVVGRLCFHEGIKRIFFFSRSIKGPKNPLIYKTKYYLCQMWLSWDQGNTVLLKLFICLKFSSIAHLIRKIIEAQVKVDDQYLTKSRLSFQSKCKIAKLNIILYRGINS